jgi:hypothetical protein
LVGSQVSPARPSGTNNTNLQKGVSMVTAAA